VDRLVIWTVRLLMALCQALEERRAMALGRRLGRLMGRMLPGRRRIVLGNLRHAYGGELPERELHALVRRNFEHYGQCAAEVLRLPLVNRENLHRHVTFHGLEHLDAARAQGLGVIILCGHYGNWEVMAVSQALHGFGAHVVTKEARNRGVNEFWMGLRRAQGVTLLPAANSALAILRVLKRGGYVALALDQHRPRAAGIQARFFGRPASTMPALASLALRVGSPVVPLDCWRDEHGHHHLEVGPAIPLAEGGTEEESILRTTQRYNDVIEGFVRRHPEQWIWIHRRWKAHRSPAPLAAPGAPRAGPARGLAAAARSASSVA
jgi:KDO2-lipid IV(A) lauroyltransferase